jgi:hypothetical protein
MTLQLVYLISTCSPVTPSDAFTDTMRWGSLSNAE